MPILSFPSLQSDSLQAGIWEITESEEGLTHQLSLWPEEIHYLSSYKDESKRKEWLASRLIIRKLLQPTEPLLSVTLEDGSPQILGWKGKVSISHTQGFAAALLSDSGIPGIDVEILDRSIPEQLKNRFLHPEELQHPAFHKVENSNEMAVLAWSAKETLFKITGRKGVSFQQDLFVNLPERILKQGGMFPAFIRNHGKEKEIIVHYFIQERLLCTWAVLDTAPVFL
jgi:phosphopantetheinyl transferase